MCNYANKKYVRYVHNKPKYDPSQICETKRNMQIPYARICKAYAQNAKN